MSWSKFTVVLAVLYAGYYLLIILTDMLKGKKVSTAVSGGDELTFSEDIQSTEVEHEPFLFTGPVNLQSEADDDLQNAVWERAEEDTEELNIISHNVNTSTGGVTEMAEVIKLAQNNTIDYKRSLVF